MSAKYLLASFGCKVNQYEHSNPEKQSSPSQ